MINSESQLISATTDTRLLQVHAAMTVNIITAFIANHLTALHDNVHYVTSVTANMN